MTKLSQCAHCQGFLPRAATMCPHCKRRALVKALGMTIGGGAIAMTLMACYGAAPCPDGSRDCYRTPPPSPSGAPADADGGGGSTSK